MTPAALPLLSAFLFHSAIRVAALTAMTTVLLLGLSLAPVVCGDARLASPAGDDG
jgi:hypothetical protein